jgi:phosphoenolpyruvate carboxylase
VHFARIAALFLLTIAYCPMPETTLRDHGLRLLEEDLRFLMQAFAAVLRRVGEPQLAEHLPWIGNCGGGESHRALGQAYSIAFQLLNIVEERVASQVRRLRERRDGAQAEPGLWPTNLRSMRELGLGEQEMLEVLRRVCVEPVLTAHPTEAKRATVRDLHLEIYALMNRHENKDYTQREQERIHGQLQVQIENLWRTGEIHLTRPSIEAELQGALYYLREVLPEAVARAHIHLREAWQGLGHDPRLIDELPPMMRFGTWIGGDRDGHPLVTAAVTAESLRQLRVNALRVQRRGLEQLAQHCPLSSLFQNKPVSLGSLMEDLVAALGGRTSREVDHILRRNAEEPWRAVAYLMRARVLATQERSSGAYSGAAELLGELRRFEQSLAEVGATALIGERVIPLRRSLLAFGFHGAVLDVRQNSAFHDQALEQLLAAAGLLDEKPWDQWSPDERRQLMERELQSPRPFLAKGLEAGEQSQAVLECYRVLAQHGEDHPEEPMGALIVSMTRSVEDLLTVYLLAREAGLLRWGPYGWVCPLAVTPLFETMADLQRGPKILAEFLAHPLTQRSLRLGGGQGSIQVMVGYSDSNKDCGILASQWALHQAQREIAAVAGSHGLEVVFFHGRGGTVGRGAGPTHWFMQALPQGSFRGRMRMTEQGETIAQKYAHLGSAVYHSELLMASAAAACARHRMSSQADGGNLIGLWQPLADRSLSAYRELLHSDAFLTFFREATPIDALENARIGSRPSRRSGQASLADLRAIPWVFSWTQSRFYLPGWFGVGSALEGLMENDPAQFQRLTEVVSQDGFSRFVLTNVESSLVSANLEMMQLYASLVEDSRVRASVMAVIVAEYDRTVRLLEVLFQGSFAQRRPRLAYTLQIREEPLRVLHRQQVELLKRWRGLRRNGQQADSEALMPELLVSINALASGLRTTG